MFFLRPEIKKKRFGEPDFLFVDNYGIIVRSRPNLRFFDCNFLVGIVIGKKNILVIYNGMQAPDRENFACPLHPH